MDTRMDNYDALFKPLRIGRVELKNRIAMANNVYCIGDCREPRNVMHAVWDAYAVARFI